MDLKKKSKTRSKKMQEYSKYVARGQHILAEVCMRQENKARQLEMKENANYLV
jgi:hypothetical protein